jgi:hypothetical protein
MTHIALEAGRYYGRGGHNSYAYYLLLRWLFHLIGSWTWLVIGVAVSAAAFLALPTSSGPGRRRLTVPPTYDGRPPDWPEQSRHLPADGEPR